MRLLRLRLLLNSAALAGLLLACLAAGARAEPPASTLERIRQTGVLRVGYGSDLPPFSYVDADGAPIGYSIELCRRLADKLSVVLGLPRIAIQYVPRVSSNRIQRINDGDIDIECAASTDTPERRAVVAFSPPHFIVTTRYVSLARNRLRRIADLRGKSVSVVLGTVNVGEITRINRAYQLNLSMVPAASVPQAFDLVSRERVSAFAMDDVLLAGLIASSQIPARYALSEDELTEPQPYGFMMRRNDVEFTRVVETVLRQIYASPEMAEIYDRWFNQAIPGKNINLHLPMSDMLRRSFNKGR